jgi:putative redox protein
MVRISVEYQGDLHCAAVHGPSGAQLQTDAPVDNQGRGETFSPTDLVATAFASCFLTIMGITARREGIPLEGTRATVDKEMTAEGPRRIARLTLHLHMSIPRSADPKDVLERAGRACPVARSLHPDVEQAVEIHWRPEPEAGQKLNH